MMKSAHAISNNYLPQPRDGKKFENLFRSDMQEVAYFSAKITSFCNQTFYPDIAKKWFYTNKHTCTLCTMYMQENLHSKTHIYEQT